MKLFRYRKPSLKRALGITQAKRNFTRMTGGAALRNPKSIVTNYERRMKRSVGYYSEPMKAVRNRHRWFGWLKFW